MTNPWLGWFKELQSIAQNGLTYSKDPYDIIRFKELREITSNMVATIAENPPEKIIGLFDQEVGAATPKIDVRGVVMQDGKILLVRQKWNSLWTIPGGWAEIGLSPSESVSKEVREEAGYIVKPVRLLGVYDRDKRGYPSHPDYIYKLFIQCEIIDKCEIDELETDASDFFEQDNLPPLYVNNASQEQIDRMFELVENNGMLPDLD